MKRILAFILVRVMTLMSVFCMASADASTDSWVSWNYNADAKELCINGTGEMPELNVEMGRPWELYADDIETVSISDGITRIPSGAFCSLPNLQNVNIPKSINSIGVYAFNDTPWFNAIEPDLNGCVVYGNFLLDYAGSENGTVVIPDNIQCIADGIGSNGAQEFEVHNNKDYAAEDGVLFNSDKSVLVSFPSGKRVTYYTVPASVKQIAPYGFASNSTLVSVELPASLEALGVGSFYYCVSLNNITLPDGLAEIGRYAFSGTGLTNIEIPDSVSEMGKGVFADSNLSSVRLPGSLTSIPEDAFLGCDNITEIQIPDSVKVIDEDAFYYCDSFAHINLPAELRCVSGMDAIPGSCLSYDMSADEDRAVTANQRLLINATWAGGKNPPRGNIDLVIPQNADCWVDGFDNTGINAFISNSSSFAVIDYSLYTADGRTLVRVPDNKGLFSVDIPEGVTQIRPYAFKNSGVSSVRIPASVEILGRNAFSYCDDNYNVLTSVTLPASIKTIEDSAFYMCDHLKDVYFEGTEKEWGMVYIGSLNDPLLKATIHFSDNNIKNGSWTQENFNSLDNAEGIQNESLILGVIILNNEYTGFSDEEITIDVCENSNIDFSKVDKYYLKKAKDDTAEFIHAVRMLADEGCSTIIIKSVSDSAEQAEAMLAEEYPDIKVRLIDYAYLG